MASISLYVPVAIVVVVVVVIVVVFVVHTHKLERSNNQQSIWQATALAIEVQISLAPQEIPGHCIAANHAMRHLLIREEP
jgi:uncharacterized membrane protein